MNISFSMSVEVTIVCCHLCSHSVMFMCSSLNCFVRFNITVGDNVYTYNPCKAFTNDDCKDVAVSKIHPDLLSIIITALIMNTS